MYPFIPLTVDGVVGYYNLQTYNMQAMVPVGGKTKIFLDRPSSPLIVEESPKEILALLKASEEDWRKAQQSAGNNPVAFSL